MLHRRVLATGHGTTRHTAAAAAAAAAAASTTSKVRLRPSPLCSPVSPSPTSSAHLQLRLFHHTPVRRLFESTGSIISACLGLVTGAALYQVLFKSRFVRVRPDAVPPGSWLKTVDLQTVRSVSITISAGFNLARSSPGHRRQDALREATFQVPYEVARFNKDAKDFRIENLGPPPSVEKFAEVAKRFLRFADGFDPQKEARVFLYFPKGSAKATAAFLAINDEFEIPDITKPSAARATAGSKNSVLINQATFCWIIQYYLWEKYQPEIIKRMEIGSGKFPVIFVYQDSAAGCEFDTSRYLFPEPATAGFVFGLSAPHEAAERTE